jgi:hypothetical protein
VEVDMEGSSFSVGVIKFSTRIKEKAVLMTNSLFSVPPDLKDGVFRSETLTFCTLSDIMQGQQWGDDDRAAAWLEMRVVGPLFAAVNLSKLGDASPKSAKPENA